MMPVESLASPLLTAITPPLSLEVPLRESNSTVAPMEREAKLLKVSLLEAPLLK